MITGLLIIGCGEKITIQNSVDTKDQVILSPFCAGKAVLDKTQSGTFIRVITCRIHDYKKMRDLTRDVDVVSAIVGDSLWVVLRATDWDKIVDDGEAAGTITRVTE